MCLPDTNLVSCVLGQDKLRILTVAPGEGRALRWMSHRSTGPCWVVSLASGGPLPHPPLGLAKFLKVEVQPMVTTAGDHK